MKKIIFVVVVLLAFATCTPVQAQSSAPTRGLSVGGGWTHVTGDFGLDGFNIDASYRFSPMIAGIADFDATFNTSTLGTLSTTSGQSVRTRLQNYLFGPRVYFPQAFKNSKFIPFGEFEIGLSHLTNHVSGQPSQGDNGFSWLLGGGATYNLTPKWDAFGRLGLLRTHFASQGQSRARFVLGVEYHF